MVGYVYASATCSRLLVFQYGANVQLDTCFDIIIRNWNLNMSLAEESAP